MSEPLVDSPVDPAAAQTALWLRNFQYIAVCVAFVFLAFLTRSPGLNDTWDYVSNIQSSLDCPSVSQCPQIWDAGHLLWRPTGYFLSRPLLPILNRVAGGDVRMAITLLLMIVSGTSILIGALLLCSITYKATRSLGACVLASIGFLCADATLLAFHSGTSYPVGMMFLTGAIWLLQNQTRARYTGRVLLAGVCAAVAVAYWLPYVVVLPALLLGVLVDASNRRLRTSVTLMLSVALMGLILFGLGAHARGVGSWHEFRVWLADSGHATEQNRNLVRSLFGLPRGFLSMGDFGLRMKQYLFHDPYTHVGLRELFSMALWKVALFYIALAAMLPLWRGSASRKTLVVFAAALLGNMALAVAFEGGSVERYFPLIPFFIITAAVCLSEAAPGPARAVMGIFFAVMILGNLSVFWANRVRAGQELAASRVEALLPLRAGSYVYALGDDIVGALRRDAPFEEINRSADFQIQGVYLAMMNTSYWKRAFADKVLSVWDAGGDVFVTTRVWADRPERNWDWVEGDDPYTIWKDFNGFFRTLGHGPAIGGQDGFFLLQHSAGNVSLLRGYAGK